MCGKVSFRTWDNASYAALHNSTKFGKAFRVYSCNDEEVVWHATTKPNVVR